MHAFHFIEVVLVSFQCFQSDAAIHQSRGKSFTDGWVCHAKVHKGE